MEYVLNLKLFYPMLFTTIVILIIAVCSTIKYMNGNTTHKGIVENIKDIFFKSSDNVKEITIDTTGKMKSMHDNVVKVDFTDKHEHELDEIEQIIDNHTTRLEQLTAKVEEINDKVDELLNQFIELRKQNKL